MSQQLDHTSLLAARAHTFALATTLLPRPRREAVTVLYSFCRTIDDLVDEPRPGMTREEIAAALADWRRWLEMGLPPHSLPEPASLAEDLREVVLSHDVPPRYLLGLVDGVASDLGPVRMANFAALRRYAVQVAGTVGLAMCHVLGTRDPIALAAAVELGIAMQLTNILRDVGGDLREGRIYFPLDELAAFGFTPNCLFDLAAKRQAPDERFDALMRQQIARAREYYARGMVGVWRLPWRTRSAILLAARLYRAILDEIEPCADVVLTRRVATSRVRKLREAALCVTLVAFYPGTQAEPGPRAVTLQEALAWLEP